jgi:hypothetical protein
MAIRVAPKVKRNAVLFLVLAGGVMWVPVARLLLDPLRWTRSVKRNRERPGFRGVLPPGVLSGLMKVLLQILKGAVGLSTAALPLAERYWFSVLPVSGRLRETLLPVAVLAAAGAAAAGLATARQTSEGLTIGWFSLVAFLATAIGFYVALDFYPRAASGLYIVFFVSFTLSVSSFLFSRGSSRLDLRR